ncbi:MAG: hypothetical protein EGQ16_07550 [Clostridiales bacterium]|nr:hypothetical protein [Clostridiales bacterium]MBD9159662.1 hypothetical protein [Clostridiales bacterium]
MNQKKNSKIVNVLIILVSIVIIAASIGIIYFTTDLFKSNKILFAKYVGQISMDNTLKQYQEKKNETPYSDEGTFSVNASANSNSVNLENVNKFTVTYKGQVDTANSKAEQNININYSDSVKFPVNYRQVGNKIALQTDYVGSKYIGGENDKLDKLSTVKIDANTAGVSTEANNQENTSTNINVDSNSINTIEKLSSLFNETPSEEDLSLVVNKITNVLNGIDNSKYSKISDSTGIGYKLSLSGDDLKNATIQLLQALSQDQSALDKINEYLNIQESSNKITSTDIEKEITNITNNENFDNQKFEATVYKKNGKTNGIDISINDNELKIEKVANNTNNLEYDITFTATYNNETMKISLKAKYNGIADMQKVQENYELGIENSENTYTYKLENNVDLTQSQNIEDLTADNSLMLTDYDANIVSSFLTQVVQRIQEVNKMQMEQLGIQESDNPIFHLIPSFGAYANAIENLNSDKISEEDVNSFNQKFELYQSTNLGGATVKGLLTTIGLNNESKETNRQIKEINFNGQEYDATTQNIAFLKEDIRTDSYYKVEFEKDQDTGLIYRAVINPK